MADVAPNFPLSSQGSRSLPVDSRFVTVGHKHFLASLDNREGVEVDGRQTCELHMIR